MSRTNTKEPIGRVSRKLFLNRETVRSLSVETLQEVAGGVPNTTSLIACSRACSWGCTTNC